VPVGRLTTVTGVSGSGKSSLVRGVLLPAVSEYLGQEVAAASGRWKKLEVGGPVERLLEVDQSPIGRTPRSIPASYVGIFDPLRKFYARLPEARIRGFGASRFSFNTDEGRCAECSGLGVKRVVMSFLPDALVPCERCEGRRYAPETLAVTYQGWSIADVLDRTVDEALELLAVHPKIAPALRLLQETGLGYLRLGQPSPTLSGGEAQRLKLVAELARPRERPTLYILEEPTIGLHMSDVRRLLGVLHRLVERGHTVVVIEHNLELISESDWVVDLGPEGGSAGGRIVAAAAPADLAARPGASHTARALQPLFPPAGVSRTAAPSLETPRAAVPPAESAAQAAVSVPDAASRPVRRKRAASEPSADASPRSARGKRSASASNVDASPPAARGKRSADVPPPEEQPGKPVRRRTRS
jgi:excinuclease ABC subunit A